MLIIFKSNLFGDFRNFIRGDIPMRQHGIQRFIDAADVLRKAVYHRGNAFDELRHDGND